MSSEPGFARLVGTWERSPQTKSKFPRSGLHSVRTCTKSPISNTFFNPVMRAKDCKCYIYYLVKLLLLIKDAELK